MRRTPAGKNLAARFAIGGALVAAIIVAAFAVHPFKRGAGQRDHVINDARQRGTHALSLADVRRAEVPTLPPSHPVATKGAQFYVAPSGRRDGDGSKARPWDLATALAQPAQVKAGDTMWLRGGTYKGAFKSALTGQDARPVLLAQLAGERATIDGSLTVAGAWATYWGFEVLDSDPDRTKERPTGVEVFGPHTKLVNLVVHDCGNGIAAWSPAVDAEVYGCIIYNNGFQNSPPDRGHGHAIYTQNEAGTKLIRDNVMFNQFGWGIHAYTEEGDITGFLFEGNVSFNNGAATAAGSRYDNILVGGERPAARVALVSNYTYQTLTVGAAKPSVRLHYGATNNQDLTVKDNHFVGSTLAADVRDWQSVSMTGNFFYSPAQLLALGLTPDAASAYTWDRNTYFQGRKAEAFTLQDKALDFPAWQQATGFDQHSRWVRNENGRPAGVEVFVRPNQYEPGRAHVVIYNWDLRATVEVDAAGVLMVGAQYEVRDAQNYFGRPVASGTYDGKHLRLPLTGLPVAPAVGAQAALASTAPEFGVFVIVRKS